MARLLNAEDLDEFDPLIQQYINHISNPQLTANNLREQLQYSIGTESRYVLGAYDENNKPVGLLIHNPSSNRISLIFANSVFSVEKDHRFTAPPGNYIIWLLFPILANCFLEIMIILF